MMNTKRKPNKRTVRDAIRASVPDGKLKSARIILKDRTDGMMVGGFTEYDRANGGKVVKVGAPASDDAFGITVRGHEGRHATRHTPTRRKPLTPMQAIAGQIVDDVNIETSPLPMIDTKRLTSYRRAHLKTALEGVRTLVKNKRAMVRNPLADNIETRNGNLLNAVRTTAMLHHYGQSTPDEIRVRGLGYRKIKDVIGQEMFRGVARIVNMAKNRRNRAKAISLLVGLMETPEPEDLPEDERPPEDEGDILLPPKDGDALDGHMRINDLRPKTVFCAKEKTISRRHAPSGVIINPNRYVNAIVSGESHGLFARRVRQKAGGTVLIDASGSMGATRENLSALCERVPTATVGYYSGYDGRGRGDLCVYAYKGKRYAGELPANLLHGGNSVDLPAVRWLLRCPKPWVLVSDLQFCGGVLGSETVARALVERERAKGTLTVYDSLDAAYDAFGGKGGLSDAEARKTRGAYWRAVREKREARMEERDNSGEEDSVVRAV